MTQIVPLVVALGPAHTGKTIGYRVLDLDGTTYSAFTTTGVVETAVAGTYYVTDGIVAPRVGGMVVVGTAGTDLLVAAIELAPVASSGVGAGTYTDTVTDGLTALDNVRVWLSLDAAGTQPVYEAWTDATGVFVMRPDVGTYYRWIEKAGYSGAQGVEVVVA